MSGRRLPLLSPHPQPAPGVNQGSAALQVLPGRAVLVADTDTDRAALRWAARFVAELDALGRAVPVVLSLAGGAVSADAGAFGPAAGRVRLLHGEPAPRWGVLAPVPAGLGAADPGARTELWVLVGQPVLCGAQGWLSVLLGAELPVLRWAHGLRALRGQLTLELSGAGLEFASALARAVAAAG